MTVIINGNGTITPTSAVQPTGSILQVKQAVKTDTASFNSNSFTDITGLSVDITATAADSKMLVMAYLYIGVNQASQTAKINIVRGTTNIGQPTSGSHQATMHSWIYQQSMQNVAMHFLDDTTFATNAATNYHLEFASDGANTDFYINRYHGSDSYRGISTLTVMEVAG